MQDLRPHLKDIPERFGYTWNVWEVLPCSLQVPFSGLQSQASVCDWKDIIRNSLQEALQQRQTFKLFPVSPWY